MVHHLHYFSMFDKGFDDDTISLAVGIIKEKVQQLRATYTAHQPIANKV